MKTAASEKHPKVNTMQDSPPVNSAIDADRCLYLARVSVYSIVLL